MSGNTEIVANLIAEKTHADIYRIKSSRKYNVFSALVGKFVVDLKDLPNLASYNTVFVGGPVWAYSMPSPLVFFLKNTDLGGKNVVSFSTNGGGVGKFHDKFRESARNAKILGTMDFYRVKNMGNLVLKNMLLDLLNTVGN
jgi:flavodoxin